MASLLARRRGLDDAGRAALRRVLADPIFELLPLKSLSDQIPHLPAGALVSVTASPAKGIDATLDQAARLQADGFRAIPHLSARMVADRATLAALLERARQAGITRAFVVGGDADEPGEYLDGLSLLRAMTELGHPFTALGCPAYPQGHPDIPDPALAQALIDKALYVDHVTTQMDFDTKAIASWVRARRAEGLHRTS
jgi:methylenetetrahydrofolate reductase (NADPH)